MEDIARKEHKKGTFRREELPERFMARKLFEQLNKRYTGKDWKEIGGNGKEVDIGEEE